MTEKERYELALAGKAPDRVPWAVNFDHWLGVNKEHDTLPAKYQDMSRLDIWRSLGVAMWLRVGTFLADSPNVKLSSYVDGDVETEVYETPAGNLTARYRLASDFTRARFLVEHMVKSPKDFAAYKFMVQDAVARADYASAQQAIADVGDDGIVLTTGPYTPYQEFMIIAAGWVNGIYLLMDYPDEVEEILEIMAAKAMEIFEIMARGPIWVCHCGDNMDTMTSPDHYRRYIIPFAKRAAEVFHKHGKLFESHYDGSLRNLLPLIPESGLDSIEAFTPAPMGDCTIRDVSRHLRAKVVVQGGVPAVALCHGFPLDELKRIVVECLEYGKGGGFILGMGDNVPPDADFSRLDFITELVDKYGRV